MIARSINGDLSQITPDADAAVNSAFDRALAAWQPSPFSKREHRADLEAALCEIESALKALGKRPGARADAARKALQPEADAIRSALAGVDALGELRPALIAEGQRIVEALRQVRADLSSATRETVRAARDALDVAEVDYREWARKVRTACDAAKRPRVPDVEPITRAREATETLAALDPNDVLSIEAALLQGANEPPSAARFWICFERKDNPLFDFRARRAAKPSRDRRENQRTAPARRIGNVSDESLAIMLGRA